jgi:SAM-dependent methyltransferase
MASFLQEFLDRHIRRRIFANRAFWNYRYANDPEKGSGPGSRGEFRTLKSQIVRATLEVDQPETVLDIGCGDIAILDDVEIDRYVGVDISPIIVKKNKLVRPAWQFVCEDMTGEFVPEPADLVLCLDVLIHQRTLADYRSILSKALGAARRVLLVSGYAAPDSGWNVFYHEPIERSVQNICPNAGSEMIAEYRGTRLLKVHVNHA